MTDSQQRYDAIVAALVGQPGVAQSLKKGFAQFGLKVDGKLFAILMRKGDLILKMPKDRVDWLSDSGDGKRFDMGIGKGMKEWVVIGPDAAIDWLELAREALAFVRTVEKK